MRYRNSETGSVVHVDDDRVMGRPWEPFDGDQGGGAPAGSEVPAQSAKKADWVDYAVSQGADRDEADASTKDDLVQQYG
jgi:hypothetical protein